MDSQMNTNWFTVDSGNNRLIASAAVMRIHPLGTIKVCTKSHGNLLNTADSALKNKNDNITVELDNNSCSIVDEIRPKRVKQIL